MTARRSLAMRIRAMNMLNATPNPPKWRGALSGLMQALALFALFAVLALVLVGFGDLS